MTRSRHGISARVNEQLVAALMRTCATRTICQTCLGKRVIVQISPELHDAWVTELAAEHGTHLTSIRTYGEFRVQQLPTMPAGAFRVCACWDCTDIPTLPDDPEAIARFLT